MTTKKPEGSTNKRSLVWAAGMDGQVELLPDRVVIHRKGLLNSLFYGFNARREIPLGAISEVMFRDASRFKYGVIEFVRSGSSVSERKNQGTCIVKFNRAQMPFFEEIKEKAFEIMQTLSHK
jgi:hypothetical protein